MKSYLFGLILFSIFVTGCNFSLASEVTPEPGFQAVAAQPVSSTQVNGPVYPPVPPDPAAGAEIYREKCAPCHGERGLGDGPKSAELANPVPALGSPEVSRRASPAAWYAMVTEGNLERFMPPFTSLTDRQRWDVVAYAYSLGFTPESLLDGQVLYQENCARCHGAFGRGDGPEAASLSSLPTDFTDQELMAGKSVEDFYEVITAGQSPDMPAFAETLTDEQRWILGDTLRTLAFSEGNPLAGEESIAMELSTSAAITATLPLTMTVGLGEVTGVVSNASGSSLPGDLPVTLHGFDDTGLVFSDTQTIDSNGLFSFSEVPMPEGRQFFASVQHQDIPYGSAVVAAQAETPSLELPIQVYDATSDSTQVVIDRLHLFIEPVSEEVMRVSELVIASNLGNATFTPAAASEAILTVQLPTEASNLEFQEGSLGDRFIPLENGFGDTNPIRPGKSTYQLLFSYLLPTDRQVDFKHRLSLPTNAVMIAIPQEGINVKGDGLQDGGLIDGAEGDYHVYTSDEIAANEAFELTLSGPSIFQSGGQAVGVLIGLVSLGFVLILAGVWLFRRNRQSSAVTGETASVPPAVETPEAVMDAILALDDLYKEGQLPEAAYQARRAELKHKLASLLNAEQTGQ